MRGGARPGAGRPRKNRTPCDDEMAWMLELRAALFNAVSPDDIKAIAAALVEKSKQGDLVAMRLLFGYVIGPPGNEVPTVQVAVLPGHPAESLESQALRLAREADQEDEAEVRGRIMDQQ